MNSKKIIAIIMFVFIAATYKTNSCVVNKQDFSGCNKEQKVPTSQHTFYKLIYPPGSNF